MLLVTERAMEWRNAWSVACDNTDNQTVHQMSGLKNIVVTARENKILWVGHVAHLAIVSRRASRDG